MLDRCLIDVSSELLKALRKDHLVRDTVLEQELDMDPVIERLRVNRK